MSNEQTKKGECEVCDKKDVELTLHYGNMWFCSSCWEREEQATAIHQAPEVQQARVDALNEKNNLIIKAREIDNSIQVRTDLFNAATVAIVDLKKEIDANESIQNKPYALAEELKTRFEHYKQVVFELNEKIIEAGNQQKAIQVYLNQLANQLRQEEREKLKIADINYKPSAPKISKPRAITTKPKTDKAELRKYAAELGISEFTLQMVSVQKGVSIAEAAKLLNELKNSVKTN